MISADETHRPDFDNLRRTLLREGPPGPVPFFEIGVDPPVIGEVLEERFPLDIHVFGPQDLAPLQTEENVLKALHGVEMFVRFSQTMGYDTAFMYTLLNLPRSFRETADTAGGAEWSDGRRFWQDETTGPIQSWADFERYPWPKPEEINYAALEYLNVIAPEGMKITSALFGIFENSSWLMGLQNYALAIYDQPGLVEAIIGRVADLSAAAVKHAVTLDNVEIIVLCDDIGSNNGTLVKPDFLKKYIFPQHRRLADIAHAAGKLFLLHSCGNLTAVMDDIIRIEQIDGKHSFQDIIMPVEDAYQRWGDRVSILGGVDMDILGRGTQEQVRRRVREILDRCGARGTGYCLGSGNTIATYVPRCNYLAMLDEGRRWNREHFGTS